MNGSNLDGGRAPAGVFSSAKIGKLGYAIGIFVGLLFLITTITLASYFCSRASGGAAPPMQRLRRRRSRAEDEESGGVDDETLKSWPEVTYAEARRRDPRAAGCCSVCLADFGEDDAGEALLRLLPECGHLFHATCVDTWLRRRPTCPVCRWSPAPTPMPTPLAEITPLATSS